MKQLQTMLRNRKEVQDMSEDHMREIKHYTCDNCGKLDIFKCMGTGLCEDCLQYLRYEFQEGSTKVLVIDGKIKKLGWFDE